MTKIKIGDYSMADFYHIFHRSLKVSRTDGGDWVEARGGRLPLYVRKDNDGNITSFTIELKPLDDESVIALVDTIYKISPDEVREKLR